jgi:hypothetical protein
MPTYRVTLHGTGLESRNAETNAILRIGFYTTRWVRARLPDSALVIARELVLDELRRTHASDMAVASITLEVDEIVQVSWFDGLRRRTAGRGFTFYPENAETRRVLFADDDP